MIQKGCLPVLLIQLPFSSDNLSYMGFMCMSGNIGTDWSRGFHPITLHTSRGSKRWFEQSNPRNLHQFTLINLLNFKHIECLTTHHCLKLRNRSFQSSHNLVVFCFLCCKWSYHHYYSSCQRDSTTLYSK